MLFIYIKLIHLIKLPPQNNSFYSTSANHFNKGILYDNKSSLYGTDPANNKINEINPILGIDVPYISEHLIDKDGKILSNLPNLSGVYAYQFISNPNMLYVGISSNLAKRHLTHVRNVKYNKDNSPLFYDTVREHGWDSFRLCILETSDQITNIQNIYSREQYYFDLLSPCLNLNHIAAPGNQGYTWTPEQSLQQSIIQRGISKPRPDKIGVSFQFSENAKNKIRLRNGGVIVNVYENDELIQSFDTLRAAGEFYKVHYSTIQRYADSSKLWDNKYIFILVPKIKRDENVVKKLRNNLILPLDSNITVSTVTRGTVVDIFDDKRVIIYKFNTVADACEILNTNRHTLNKYNKSGLLWLNKWYVKYHN